MKIFREHESQVRSYCRSFPKIFDKAVNADIWDEQGEKYLDLLSGAGTLNYGHNNPELISAIIDYIGRQGILHSLDLHTSAKSQFIDSFVTKILSPRAMKHRLLFPGPTGTNAVEVSLKIARKVTGRTNIVSFTNGFHGVTLGALAATGSKKNRDAAGTSLSDVTHAAYDGYFGMEIDTIDMIEKLLSDPSSGWVPPAAFLVETVQGEGGLNVASTAWLAKLRKLATSVGSLLIVDDIQAGCGRCGDFFSFDGTNLSPDIICLSKSLSGVGLPLALVLVKPEFDALQPGDHNGTFRGNNLAFVAGAAALDKYWSDTTFSNAVKLHSQSLNSKLNEIQEASPHIIESVVGRGMMMGLRFKTPSKAAEVSALAFSEGNIIAETCGPHDGTLKFLPPLTIEADRLSQGMTILSDIVKNIQD